MFETSSSNMQSDYYISNEKIYPKNDFCYKLSNNVKFDAEKFAVWMQDGYRNSICKSYSELAAEVKSNKATISRLMTGAPQTLTSKPSQPNKDLVKRLANFYKKDVNEALMLAGHAPESDDLQFMDFEGLDKEDIREIKQFIDFLKSRKFKTADKEGFKF